MHIVAHRGNHDTHTAPENTLAATMAAWQTGVDSVEVDVRLSKDTRIVLMHDGHTGTTGEPDIPVGESTLAQLRRCTITGRGNRAAPGFPVATLDEIIEAVPPGKSLYLDIKEDMQGIGRLLRELRKKRYPARSAFIGFSAPVMAAVKKAFPQNPAYLLFEAIDVRMAIEQARAAALDGIDVQALDSVDGDFALATTGSGLQLHVWGVKDEECVRRMLTLGVCSMTTDRPGMVRAVIGDQ
jgi:glycerophosphoryl diester phosphodiesterase